MSFTPKHIAEIHLTYRCNLSCVACNRMCYLKPSTVDMTIDDVKEFFRQANTLQWKPEIRFLGGEPTKHYNLLECLWLAKQFVSGDITRVQLWSNNYGTNANSILQQVVDKQLATIVTETHKTGSVEHVDKNICVAPVDGGILSRNSCWQHAANGVCGVSVDAEGYTICPCGGAIDGILKLGLRTKILADLFNSNFARQQTIDLCRYCGWYTGDSLNNVTTETIRGTKMSKTWAKSVQEFL